MERDSEEDEGFQDISVIYLAIQTRLHYDNCASCFTAAIGPYKGGPFRPASSLRSTTTPPSWTFSVRPARARLVPPPSCVARCRMGRLMGPFPSLAQVKGAPMGRPVLRRSGWAVAYCGLHVYPGGRRGFDRRFISRKVAFLFEGSSAHRRSRLHGRQSRIELGLSPVSSVTRERCNHSCTLFCSYCDTLLSTVPTSYFFGAWPNGQHSES